MDFWLIEFFEAYPYAGVAAVFVACGLGLPLPEELVLLGAGFVVYQDFAERIPMMAVCAASILAGDLIPFAVGRAFGPRVLRIRLLRFFITPERLARFDHWFRRRGDWVVLISRFIAGIRVVSFFTAGTMRMSWSRFLILDGAGILMIVPPLVWVGDRYGSTIEAAVSALEKLEKGILITVLSLAVILGLWSWVRWRRKQKALVGSATETYVEPSTSAEADAEGAVPDALPADGLAPDDPAPDPAASGRSESGGLASDDQGPGGEPEPADPPAIVPDATGPGADLPETDTPDVDGPDVDAPDAERARRSDEQPDRADA